MIEKTKWNVADNNGTINVPNELDGAVNKVATQLRLHTISGKNEAQTVVDIVYSMEKYFKELYSSKPEFK